MNIKIMQLILLLVILTSCSNPFDECKSYSDFTCKEIKRATYNVYFYSRESEKTVYIGRVEGLNACAELSWRYAGDKDLQRGDWGYVCCMVAKGSQCYEKHR